MGLSFGGFVRKVVFAIDGWFMRKRIYQLKAFYYTGPKIREYCLKHLEADDYLYRIFYYDTEPLEKKGHNPLTKKHIDFGMTKVANEQRVLLESIKKTPNFALRLGKTVWQNNEWVLHSEKLKALLNGKILVNDLREEDIRPVIKQKAVDMKLGLDITEIALRRLADLLVIITGDADIVPVLKCARRNGMQVLLDPLWNPVKADLQEHVDFVRTKIPKPVRPGVIV